MSPDGGSRDDGGSRSQHQDSEATCCSTCHCRGGYASRHVVAISSNRLYVQRVHVGSNAAYAPMKVTHICSGPDWLHGQAGHSPDSQLHRIHDHLPQQLNPSLADAKLLLARRDEHFVE